MAVCSRRSCPCTNRGCRSPRRPDPRCRTMHGVNRLSPLLVRDADGGHILDLGMSAENLLHLGRIDVLAAADDHVALAIGEIESSRPRRDGPCRRPCNTRRGTQQLSSPAISSNPETRRAYANRVRRLRRRRPRRPSGSRSLILPVPRHSRPIEPSLVNCSSGRSTVTHPASVEP